MKTVIFGVYIGRCRSHWLALVRSPIDGNYHKKSTRILIWKNVGETAIYTLPFRHLPGNLGGFRRRALDFGFWIGHKKPP